MHSGYYNILLEMERTVFYNSCILSLCMPRTVLFLAIVFYYYAWIIPYYMATAFYYYVRLVPYFPTIDPYVYLVPYFLAIASYHYVCTVPQSADVQFIIIFIHIVHTHLCKTMDKLANDIFLFYNDILLVELTDKGAIQKKKKEMNI